LEKGYSLSQEIGKTGLEEYYEDILRGKVGKKRIEPGPIEKERITAFEPPEDGKNLILTIDFELQKILATALEKWTKFYGGKSGAAVVLAPKTGEILAIISYPFFDNNLFSRGISTEEFEKIINDPQKPLFFRAISGEYLPGSTIKLAIALAALEEGVIDEKTTFLSTGGIKVGKWFFSDWKKDGHGLTNFKKGLAESVNTFFYTIGGGNANFQGLGPEKIALYLKKFGLGEKTNIDLPYEKEGFIPSPSWKKENKNEDWFIGDTYNLSIGHGDIKVTPLQIANLTAAIANEGKIYQPKILKEISDSRQSLSYRNFKNEIPTAPKQSLVLDSDRLRDRYDPAPLSKGAARREIVPIRQLAERPIWEEKNFTELPFKKENFRLVKEGLREAVISGTAKVLETFPLEVAGKTGTAEAGKEKPHSWFTCFAPYNDPEIVVTVIIENGGEGSGPALQTAKEVLEWWYNSK
ncbi:MAG: hypothetical protein C0412_11360, partial [Flavobacterium sp.]|nr:hypothetical protein [Flavobacterium sp.]